MLQSSPRTSPRQSPRSAPNAVHGGLTLPRVGLLSFYKDGVALVPMTPEKWLLLPTDHRAIYSSDGGTTINNAGTVITAIESSGYLNDGNELVGTEDKGYAQYEDGTSEAVIYRALKVLGVRIRPTQIIFDNLSGVELSTVTESAAATILGIEAPARFAVTGGELEKNDSGTWATNGKVVLNDTIKLRLTSSDENSTPLTALVRIEGMNASFTVTTITGTVVQQELTIGGQLLTFGGVSAVW